MRSSLLAPVALILTLFNPSRSVAQCTTTNATTCQCRVSGATTCELLPDIQISWYALQNYASGPNQYAQNATSNAGRLRVSGSTPNQGFGPLEVRGVNSAGQRTFICGPDTVTVNNLPSDNNGFTCSNGYEARQRLYQRVYRKVGNTMTYTEELRGTMTYHPTHNHYHVDDWTTMTLRIEQAGVSDPREWPIVATGAKLGFCLMDLSTCPSSTGHCRTSQLYNQGTALNSSSNFPNYGLGIGYSCSENFQGISAGKTDIYSESLDGMWINLLPGNPGLPVLCNGNYWIVAEVDPRNAWREENEENNYTMIPITINTQKTAGSGGTGSILTDKRALLAPGQSITLTATPGYSYLWSNGATSRSISVSSAGTYSCTVTAPCGSIATPSITVSSLAAPAVPTGTGATVLTGNSAQISATGSNVRWYDAPSGGSLLGSGNAFNTPVLTSTTDYWAADVNVSNGQTISAGKEDNSGGGGYFNGKHWLYFDAYEPFKLESFKVYANSFGKRQFVVRDQLGNLIHELFIELAPGMTEVQVNWDIPAGINHAITAFDDNSDVYQDLYRNNAGVSYPYAIGSLGSITGSSGGSGVYYFLYDWRVSTNDVISESARTMVTANVSLGVSADVKAMLDGPFNAQSGLMNDGLRAAGLIPSSEPFTALGFTHAAGGGGETATPAFLQSTGANAPVDWVLLELRSASNPTQIVATRSALVTRNGDVVSGDGGEIRFGMLDGNFHLAVRHRNHHGCMTAAPVALNQGQTTMDFRDIATTTFGTDARKNNGGTMTLWSGNVQRDLWIKYVGEQNDRDPILTAIGGTVPTNTTNGYLMQDANLDGVVKYVGEDNDRDLILQNIGGSIPTNVRVEQLP
ncbi:MAG: lysyl oxidase family protein [Flavobacteriales bacterium]